MRHKLITLFLATLLAACGGMPKHEETRADQATQIVLTNLPSGAAVTINGREMFGTMPGTTIFPVEPGMHTVVVKIGPSVIYEREIFLESGTNRVIIIKD